MADKDSNTKFLDQLEAMGKGGAAPAPEAEEGKIQYTSHPIANYKIGTKYVFENGVLTLDSPEEEQEFLKVIDSKKFPPRERALIRKLDFAAAERIARENIAKSRARVTQTIDSTAGERPDNSPKVGTGDLLRDNPGREALGVEAAAEGGREQNVPGAPDSNRETQTEPSPQDSPETPFRAEAQGAGGQHSAEQLVEETTQRVPNSDEAMAQTGLGSTRKADGDNTADANAESGTVDHAAREDEHKQEGESQPKGPFASLHKG